VAYFSWLCEELLLTHPHCFYSISYDDIVQNEGVWINVYYNASKEDFVVRLNPEMKWNKWLFRANRKWENVTNNKKYFGWVGEGIGFEGEILSLYGNFSFNYEENKERVGLQRDAQRKMRKFISLLLPNQENSTFSI